MNSAASADYTTASLSAPCPPWRLVHSEASLGFGGQERRVLAELTGFRRRGYSVWLIAPPRAELAQAAARDGLDTLPLAEARGRFPFEVVRLLRWFRRVRPHVVNTHSSRDGWLVGLAARGARVPFLVRTRHIDVDYPQAWLSRHAYTTFADHVLTTSARITAHFQQRFGLPPERLSTIPTGIDLDHFRPEGPRAALASDPTSAGPTPPRIGMISVLRSWKGHATFFEAARRLLEQGRRLEFIVAGSGGAPPEWMQARLREARAEGLIRFLGHRDDVPEVLRALSVLCIPSTRHEGVPQIGLQAFACGTPVVGSDAGGIPEIVREGETGRLFPAGDAAALAGRIVETLDQTEATRALSRRARALVEQHHGLDAMLDRLEALYQARL